MAAPDTAKRGQVPDMKPTAETDPGDVPQPKGAVPKGAILEADLQAHIGRQLRAVYDEVVNEAVPDRFLRLLEELERKKSEEA
jgi:hypothetical protein